ncbi:MAG TPA: carbon starvation CstA 5TM domain-containing protein, partial [Planctomycetia bacterium]|nr:carbon starvation CstA 5TM domain-containing protein [Planctomycetia bacterium]
IACGACSGFHSLIASGTTSKQLRKETDAKSVGYGAMLLEAMVGVVSLCCVMMLAPGVPLLAKEPNFLYAGGIAAFLKVVGVPMVIGIAFGLMAFTTFVYDTLDVCTRLGRFILQELFGWTGAAGRWTATVITVLAPLPFLMWIPTDAAGKIVPVWRTFWRLFGASNQLLAALTLLGVTVWLWRTRRAMWVWFVTGIPTAWMYLNSMWALGATIRGRSGSSSEFFRDAVPSVALVLFTLGALLLVEALIVVARSLPPRPPQPALQPA